MKLLSVLFNSVNRRKAYVFPLDAVSKMSRMEERFNFVGMYWLELLQVDYRVGEIRCFQSLLLKLAAGISERRRGRKVDEVLSSFECAALENFSGLGEIL